MLKQARGCPQKTFWDGRGSTVCYFGKYYWRHLFFSCQSCWICCETCMSFNRFCCKIYWNMANAKSEKVDI